jgi:uncharacterized membrane protein YoaK (UPF0700 family)
MAHKSPTRLPKIESRSDCQSVLDRCKVYLLEDVDIDLLLEVELMGLALAAGINDATTFPDYRVFASNQTGNTALLAVGALGIGGKLLDLRYVGFSLGMFVLGGYIFGQLGDRFGRKRRAWLLFTNVLQTLLVYTAAALRMWVAKSNTRPPSWSVISLLAFASGGQVAMARTINVPEITTAMVTSAYIDLLADPDIFELKNRSRNRRFFFVCSLLAGSFIGATAYKHVGPAFSLLLSAICKTAICIAIFFNRQAARGEIRSKSMQQKQPV